MDDVWIVGGREGPGQGPVVFHFDGTSWTKLDTGVVDVDLWQVFGFAGGPVYMGGSNGNVLRYHRNGTFERLSAPTTGVVFGLWGSAPDAMWAVGGQPAGPALISRLEGGGFVEVPGAPADLATGGAVWKVSGRSATEVWMSASRGYVLRWDGALAPFKIGADDESLFSMGCNAVRCITAGADTTNGVLYENESHQWVSKVPSADEPQFRGVTPVGNAMYIVGQFGAIRRRTDTGWESESQRLTTESLHAAWSDADGNVFAVGGRFDRTPTTNGVVIFKGAATLPMLP